MQKYTNIMKLLIIFSSMEEAKYFIEWLITGKKIPSELQNLGIMAPYQLFSYEIEGINIDVVIAGETNFETSFHTTSILRQKRYHLALQIGTAISNDDKIAIGDLVNVINDKPLDISIIENNTKSNAYDCNLLNLESYPHQMGGFVNKTNAYFNVFLDVKKVAGASMNEIYLNDINKQNELKSNAQVHIHCLNGIGYSYSCLYLKQAFYQLRIIINNRTDNKVEKTYALQKASTELIEIIKKIS